MKKLIIPLIVLVTLIIPILLPANNITAGTVDKYIANAGQSNGWQGSTSLPTWATVHAVTTSPNAGGSIELYVGYYSYDAGDRFDINRAIIGFDVDSVPAGAYAASVFLKVQSTTYDVVASRVLKTALYAIDSTDLGSYPNLSTPDWDLAFVNSVPPTRLSEIVDNFSGGVVHTAVNDWVEYEITNLATVVPDASGYVWYQILDSEYDAPNTRPPLSGAAGYKWCRISYYSPIGGGNAAYLRFYTADAPTLTTNAASAISYTSATIAGNITNTGGELATSRGFDWDVNSGAPYASDWTEAGSFDVGAFTHGLTGLIPKTTYYFRAKATNSGGTGVGAEDSFTTLNVVQTDAVNSFYTTTTGIRFNGQILYATGFTIDNVGFVYDTSSHGDPGNIAPSTTVYPNYHTTSGIYGVESFVYDASGLTVGSTYYYRAYAHLSLGVWVYGDELTEDTFNEVLWYQPVSIISGTTLPDRAGTAQNGIINWGANPAGIGTSVGPAVPINPPVHTPTPTEPVPTFYPGTPTPPAGTLYPTAFEPVFPGGEFINDMLDAGGIPRSFWWNFIAFLTAIAGGFGVYGMIHSRAGTSSSALLAQAITSGTILGVWWAVGIIDWWIIPLFAIEALAIIVAKQQYSW